MKKPLPAAVAAERDYRRRLAWFHQARFGLFVHYGLYSALERGEWVMFNERIPPAAYATLAPRLSPRRGAADEWCRLAAQAGMKYAVFTARHHDGFCLYDSAVSDFTLARQRGGRDLVAEFVAACRRHGLRVGLYYSLLDWRFPGYFAPRAHPDSARALVAQVHAQVRELLSHYGRVDLLWYDGGWISHGRVTDVPPADFWRARELNAMARKLQPDILINDRAGTREDLDTPEQHVTASQPGRGWESCMTVGDSAGWGYVRHSPNLKTVPQLLQNLVTAAAGEGNFLLNIGPRPDGTVRSEERVRLRAMGAWLRANGAAIYGSARCDLPDQALPGAPVGMWTRRGRTAFLHVFRWPGTEVVLPLIGGRVRAARVLATGRRLGVRQEFNGRLVLSGLPARPPHPALNTLAIEFAQVPRRLPEADHAAWIDGRAGGGKFDLHSCRL